MREMKEIKKEKSIKMFIDFFVSLLYRNNIRKKKKS